MAALFAIAPDDGRTELSERSTTFNARGASAALVATDEKDEANGAGVDSEGFPKAKVGVGAAATALALTNENAAVDGAG